MRMGPNLLLMRRGTASSPSRLQLPRWLEGLASMSQFVAPCAAGNPVVNDFSGRNRRTRATAPTRPDEPTAHRSAQAPMPTSQKPRPWCASAALRRCALHAVTYGVLSQGMQKMQQIARNSDCSRFTPGNHALGFDTSGLALQPPPFPKSTRFACHTAGPRSLPGNSSASMSTWWPPSL
jgi:hypothetical protein